MIALQAEKEQSLAMSKPVESAASRREEEEKKQDAQTIPSGALKLNLQAAPDLLTPEQPDTTPKQGKEKSGIWNKFTKLLPSSGRLSMNKTKSDKSEKSDKPFK